MFFFFNDTATTEIYTLSLHDALPIWQDEGYGARGRQGDQALPADGRDPQAHGADREHPHNRAHLRPPDPRSEEHTSELQSRQYLVCRLLLEKKKKKNILTSIHYNT